jgi:phosphatidylglycerol:prolipoprotein diacylglycerol transferase
MDFNPSPIPGFDPVLISIGPFDLRWYALAYICGLLLGWRLAVRLVKTPALWTPAGAAPVTAPVSTEDLDDLLFWVTIGVIVGGRLGYVLFYMHQTDPGWWERNPFQAFQIWSGGMSFHGGLLGVALALWWTARSRKLDILRLGDIAAVATPIGLFFGRIANFINGELYGRPSDVPWAMRFPAENPGAALETLPTRHPSQLYEAALEGALLFAILMILVYRFKILTRPGLAAGVFLIGYGLGRSFVEFFREPDAGLENLPFGLTMGMILSTPMWIAGAYLLWRGLKAPADAAALPTRPAA